MAKITITNNMVIDIETIAEANYLLELMNNNDEEIDIRIGDYNAIYKRNDNGSVKYAISYVNDKNELFEYENANIDIESVKDQINKVKSTVRTDCISNQGVVKVIRNVYCSCITYETGDLILATKVIIAYNNSYLELLLNMIGDTILFKSIEAWYHDNVYETEDIGFDEDGMYVIKLTNIQNESDTMHVLINIEDLTDSYIS